MSIISWVKEPDKSPTINLGQESCRTAIKRPGSKTRTADGGLNGSVRQADLATLRTVAVDDSVFFVRKNFLTENFEEYYGVEFLRSDLVGCLKIRMIYLELRVNG